MSEIVQDMQTTTSVMEILNMLLSAAQAKSNALSTLLNNSGSVFDSMSLQVANQEARVLKDFIKHMEKGFEVKTVEVLNQDQAALMTKLLKSEGIPFIANQTEKGMLFMYKDTDSSRFVAVAKEAERYVQDKGHEMLYEEFEAKIASQQDYFKVSGLTAEEVATFRREADKSDEAFVFAIKDGEKGLYDIYANKKEPLENTVVDTLFVMGTPEGQKYAKELVPFDKNRDDFIEKARAMSNNALPAYIVDIKNPTKIIELSGSKYKTHGVGVDKDGQMVDTVTRFSKPISHDIYGEMAALHMEKPVLLTPTQATTFIKGLSRDGTIEFDARYNGSPEKFIGLSQFLEDKFGTSGIEVPLAAPKLEVVSMSDDFREKARSMTVYQNVPLATLLKVEKANIDGVYIYNKGNTREIACTPEAAEALNTILKENLAKDKGPLDTWLTMEKYKGHGEPGEDKGENYYILDASFPDAILEVSPQDVTYKDTEVVKKLEVPEGSSRDDMILAQVAQMGHPIILSQEAYGLLQDEGFEVAQQIIENHYVNPMNSNVIRAEQDRLDNERKKLDELIGSPENQKILAKDITPAQQYVLKQLEKRELEPESRKSIEVKEFDVDREKSTKEPKAKDVDVER